MTLDELRFDSAKAQKKGLHFILASVLIWQALTFVHLSELPILTKNLLTFCCATPLLPIAYGISKLIRVDFQHKSNPLTSLGLLFSLNQILYLLIAMWIYNAVSDKMLMVMAIIFGAHLLPYGWLYNSKAYYALSVVIPIVALFVGLTQPAYILAIVMTIIELLFSLRLWGEVKKPHA